MAACWNTQILAMDARTWGTINLFALQRSLVRPMVAPEAWIDICLFRKRAFMYFDRNVRELSMNSHMLLKGCLVFRVEQSYLALTKS